MNYFFIKVLRMFGVVFCVMLMVGCAADVLWIHQAQPIDRKDYAYYSVTSLPDAEFMPAESELRHESAKVMVISGDDENATIRALHFNEQVSKFVIATLSANGIGVVDNGLAQKLGDVFRIAESRGLSNFSGPELANYVVKPVVRIINYRADRDLGDNEKDIRKARFIHAVEVKMALQIYEIPSLKTLASIKIEGAASTTTAQRTTDDATGRSLLAIAMDQGISQSKAVLLEVFARKGAGYVVAKKINNQQKAIFLITLGSEDGLKAGNFVSIYSRRNIEYESLVKNAPEYEDVLVAEGRVTDILMPHQAWIVLIDPTDVPRVMRGDIVRVESRRR